MVVTRDSHQLRGLSSAHIAVADPTPFHRRVIADLFNDGKSGRVEFYDNGATLIESCTSSVPDIVIIDDKLPFVNGVELLRTLSVLPSFERQLPKFILFIDDSTRSNVQDAIAGGFAAVIKKPFVPNYLMQIIRQCFLDLNHQDVQP